MSFLVASALNFSDVTGDIGIKGPAMCRDIAIADFDGDGDLDLFVASNLSNSSRLYENLGEGEFLEAEYFPGIDVTPGIKMALAVDLDADGDPDLVTVEAVEGSNLCLYLNNGQGSFEDKRGLPALPEPGSRCFLAFDFNGDSVSDLMYGDREGKLHVFDGKDSYLRDLADPMGLSHIHSVVKFFLSEGREGLTLVTMERNGMIKSFAFRNGAFYQTDESLISGALDLIPCDVNADGKVDLLVPCENGLALLERNREEIRRREITLPVSMPLLNLKASDLNLDGYVDFVAIDTLGHLHAFIGGKYGNFDETELPLSDNGAIGFRIADLDDDGRVDIIVLTDEGPIVLQNRGDGGNFLKLRFSQEKKPLQIASACIYAGDWKLELLLSSIMPAVVGIPHPFLDSLKVFWPDGSIDCYQGLEVNSVVELDQGKSEERGGEETEQDTLFWIYPNPTKGSFTLYFNVETSSRVTVQLLSLSGQTLKVLLDEQKDPGAYSLFFPGEELNPGTYLVRITLGDRVIQQKVVILH